MPGVVEIHTTSEFLPNVWILYLEDWAWYGDEEWNYTLCQPCSPTRASGAAQPMHAGPIAAYVARNYPPENALGRDVRNNLGAFVYRRDRNNA